MDLVEIERAFHIAQNLPPADRSRYLDRLTADHPDLARELRTLLAAADAAAFLDEPATLLAAEPEPEPEPAADESLAGLAPGGFRLVRRIGSGGMGEVFEAWQEAPRRRVAVKLLRARHHPAALRRFAAEADTLARLEHPHIARVLASGVATTSDGRGTPWIAMELVEDPVPITTYARESGLDRRARVELFVGVCAAVHHAHRRGILHRDLKPANVLVPRQGEASPRIIDFGIARSLGGLSPDDAERTRAGELLGSLHWMSPEHATGDPDAIDVRSDVYSLGVILHEMCCDALPRDLDGVTLIEALDRVRAGVTADPRATDPTLDRDLAAVIATALRPDPDHRYDSAAALADDLEAWLGLRPVRARPIGVAARLRLFARRRRAAFAMLAAASLALLATGATIAILWLEAGSARRTARAALLDLAALQRVVDDQLGRDRVSLAQAVAPTLVRSYRQDVEATPSPAERRGLVAESLRTLGRVAAGLDDDPAGRALLAAAYEDVGALLSPDWYGDPRDARICADAFRRALALRAQLRDADPTDRPTRHAWLAAAVDYIDACRKAGMQADALEIADEAVELARADRTSHPEDPQTGRRLIEALWARSDLRIGIPPWHVGLDDTREARQIGRELLAAAPGDLDAIEIQAWTLYRLGIWTHLSGGDVPGAIECQQRSLELRLQRCAAAPRDANRALAALANSDRLWDILAIGGRAAEIRGRLTDLLDAVEPARTPDGRLRLLAGEVHALASAFDRLPPGDRDWCVERIVQAVTAVPDDRLPDVFDLSRIAGWLVDVAGEDRDEFRPLWAAARAALEADAERGADQERLLARLRELATR